MRIQIYSDGGSRGNPGEAAIGFVLKDTQGVIYEYGEPIGIATNNVAEYRAVLSAIKTAKGFGFKEVELNLDSQLVERQLNGAYQVKSEELMPFYAEIKNEIKGLESFRANHIRRELNKDADRLVNLALDQNQKIVRDLRFPESEMDLPKIGKNSSNKDETENRFGSIQEIFFKYNILCKKMELEDRELLIKIGEKTQIQFFAHAQTIMLELKKIGLSKVTIEVEL